MEQPVKSERKVIRDTPFYIEVQTHRWIKVDYTTTLDFLLRMFILCPTTTTKNFGITRF
jgi:hypothetical protein